MDPSRIVGSAGIRVATLAVLLLSATGVLLRDHIVVAGAGDALFFSVIGGGFLALIGLIHSFRAVYSRWLRLAKLLQTLVITILFGACYLLIVPLFFVILRASDPLRLRTRSEPESFWLPRRGARTDEKSLARMG